jgi:hypothetical protein
MYMNNKINIKVAMQITQHLCKQLVFAISGYPPESATGNTEKTPRCVRGV